MTRETAERVMSLLLRASGNLNAALKICEDEGEEFLFKPYRTHTGKILGSIYIDMMKPIAAQYPDLDPGSN